MKHLIIRCIPSTFLLLCATVLTVSAQTGPFNPASTGSDGQGGNYPASLCTSYTSHTCIIEEACYSPAGCTSAGASSAKDAGGMNNWPIYGHYDSQPDSTYNTNGSGTSQGYIVVIGSTGQTWYFSPDGNTLSSWAGCTFSPIQSSTFTNTNFGSSKYYYRTLNLCN
jgi:hypothetical protein